MEAREIRAQTAAFHRRLAAGLVNSIFLSAYLYYTSLRDATRARETDAGDDGELPNRDRLTHATGATRGPLAPRIRASRKQCVGVRFARDPTSGKMFNG